MKKYFTSWDDVPIVLNVEETAVLLNASISTIQRKCKDGAIPANKTLTGKYAIPREPIKKIFENLAGVFDEQ